MLNNQDEIWDEYMDDDGEDYAPEHPDAPHRP
jgi:hypothetical protein